MSPQPRRTLLRWLLVGFAWFVAGVTVAPAVPGTVHVRIPNVSYLSSAALDTAVGEIDRAWASAGIIVDRSAAQEATVDAGKATISRSPDTGDSIDGSENADGTAAIVQVVLKTHIVNDPRRTRAPLDRGEGVPLRLAWINVSPDPHHALVFVAVDRLRALLQEADLHGPPWSHLPRAAQDELLGRALGRLIAHEIGHYINGPSHMEDGLMKPTFTTADLLAPQPPPAPERVKISPLR